MKKITKRDLLFFAIGLLVMFLIETIYDWDGTVESFKKGWNAADNIEEVKLCELKVEACKNKQTIWHKIRFIQACQDSRQAESLRHRNLGRSHRF